LGIRQFCLIPTLFCRNAQFGRVSPCFCRIAPNS
jgi:hypothetical protein